MCATLKNFVSVLFRFFSKRIFLKNKKTFQKLKQFYFHFANVFENIFVFKKLYFHFGNTFTFVCKLKSFRLKNKNNFTFISKTL